MWKRSHKTTKVVVTFSELEECQNAFAARPRPGPD